MGEIDADKGVLGNLPHRRPGVESPRRAAVRQRVTDGPSASEPPGTPASRSELEELERLAAAGVRLAGGAAGSGLRLAGRAVGGLGRVVGRG